MGYSKYAVNYVQVICGLDTRVANGRNIAWA
jgi:hypothetical protein